MQGDGYQAGVDFDALLSSDEVGVLFGA